MLGYANDVLLDFHAWGGVYCSGKERKENGVISFFSSTHYLFERLRYDRDPHMRDDEKRKQW